MKPHELPPIDVRGHLAQLREVIADQQLDAAVLTNLTNIRWSCGFTGSNAVLYADPAAVALVTDGRYAEQAPRELAAAGIDADVIVAPDPLVPLRSLLGSGPVGIEADHVTWQQHTRWKDQFAAELMPLAAPVVELRAYKDAGELARIRRAAAIADDALAEVVPLLSTRPTEQAVALALEVAMRERGATSSAYETIVAGGPNGALPHARPTSRLIEPGDLVIIDVGALYDGYRSDMTRTFVIGAPTPQQQHQLDVVREAQELGVAAVRDGVAAADIDAACRGFITGAGWGPEFGHGTGHGVGLDIHELPSVNSRATTTVHDSMVVTVEPGVYLPGEGGVRWEDLLVVGPDGAEPVTLSPKDPVVSLS